MTQSYNTLRQNTPQKCFVKRLALKISWHIVWDFLRFIALWTIFLKRLVNVNRTRNTRNHDWGDHRQNDLEWLIFAQRSTSVADRHSRVFSTDRNSRTLSYYSVCVVSEGKVSEEKGSEEPNGLDQQGVFSDFFVSTQRDIPRHTEPHATVITVYVKVQTHILILSAQTLVLYCLH